MRMVKSDEKGARLQGGGGVWQNLNRSAWSDQETPSRLSYKIQP